LETSTEVSWSKPQVSRLFLGEKSREDGFMLTNLKKILVSGVCIFAFLLVATHPALADTKPPAPGETLPSFKLTIPENDQARSYLGLSGSGQFAVAEIETQVVIIEIFNMY
jgi:hypothetical protein